MAKFALHAMRKNRAQKRHAAECRWNPRKPTHFQANQETSQSLIQNTRINAPIYEDSNTWKRTLKRVSFGGRNFPRRILMSPANYWRGGHFVLPGRAGHFCNFYSCLRGWRVSLHHWGPIRPPFHPLKPLLHHGYTRALRGTNQLGLVLQ